MAAKLGKCDACDKIGEVEQISSGHWLCLDCQISMTMATHKSIEHIYSKIVGVSHRNKDGRKRQSIIKKLCHDGMSLNLVPEPDNEHDRNAIAVHLPTGEQLGYLKAELAAKILPMVLGDESVGCCLTNVTQAYEGSYYGVNIVIIIGEPGSTAADLQEYIDTVVGPELVENMQERTAADDDDEMYDL